MRTLHGSGLIACAIVVLVAACSAGGTSSGSPVASPSSAPAAAPSPTKVAIATPSSSAAWNPLASPVIDGAFDVGDGRKLYMQCYGEGSPTIILEAGHPSSGIEQFVQYGGTFTSRLATERRVCAYDRAGYGLSDPAPNESRQLEDVHADLRALLEAAGVDGPYVLVGSSFGGFIVTTYASRYPEGVEGVVMLDVPAPSATLSLDDAPELAWDDPTNPERLDVVGGFENRLASERFPFDAPLLVITATGGQSSVEDQQFWLDWSDSSRQVELDGAHAVYSDQPDAVADEILAMGD